MDRGFAVGVHARLKVFPTRVGMDRLRRRQDGWTVRIPHTRGDGPAAMELLKGDFTYSPHAWGWTGMPETVRMNITVFPTRVGMDRLSQPVAKPKQEYSPHAWGWTTYGIQKNTTLESIPHTRGDGPPLRVTLMMNIPYSPHAWGWTNCFARLVFHQLVFPTRVGMDH